MRIKVLITIAHSLHGACITFTVATITYNSSYTRVQTIFEGWYVNYQLSKGTRYKLQDYYSFVVTMIAVGGFMHIHKA